MPPRLRFAPSPTGYLHVGGARTALFNWLLARKAGGAFILRIEDTDRARSDPAHTRAILDGLKWLGLDWDEEPFFQGEGAGRHRADAFRLLAEGKAYRDFMSREELHDVAQARGEGHASRIAREVADAVTPAEEERRVASGQPFAVRFRVPEGETAWVDLVHGEMRFDNADIEDVVILRSDGSATYNLAVVSDDRELRISEVLRGDDHLSNTPKQILLYRALGFPVPRFGHLPLILGSDGRRLSKRHGATAVGEYAKEGILPEAMVNFLALLGWSPGEDGEVFSREELVARFSLDRVLRKSAVFDLQKLGAINGRYLAAAPAERLAPLVRVFLDDMEMGGGTGLSERSDGYLRLIDLLKVRARSVREIAVQAGPFLTEEVTYEPAATRKHWSKEPERTAARLEAVRARFEGCLWGMETLEEELRTLAGERGIGAGKLIHPLRVALTGRRASPGIFDVLVLLGRERSLARIDQATRLIRAASFPGADAFGAA